MSAGTIKLTNGSTSVVGTSTAFTSDLKSGDVITATVGGIFFTLFVDAVTSNTALTLTDPFTGPTTSGLAWVAVPQLTLNRITAALAAQTAESVRRVLQENANWQAFYSGTGDITVTLPDGTPAGRPVPGPSWSKISGLVNSALQWRGALPSNANLNTYGPTSAFTGAWSRSVTSNTTAAYNFPEDAGPGVLEVMPGGLQGCTQRYTTGSGNIYVRSLTAAWNGTDGPWDAWKLAGVNTRPGFYSGDLNSLVLPGTWATTNTVTNAPTISGSTTVNTGICEVILRNASNTVLQRFTNMTSGSTTYNFTWQRTLYGTTWSPWELLGTKALNDLGIGIPVPMVSAMDWQTFNFIPGAQHVCLPSNQTNIPSGLTYAGTSSPTNINVLGGRAGATALVLLVTQFTQSASGKSYFIVMSGSAGSRTFAVYENFTTASVIPIANGGTGSSSPFGTTSGKFAQGNDERLNTINGKSGGTVKGDSIVLDNTYGHSTQLMTYNPGSAGTHFGGMLMKRPNSQGYVLSQYSTSDYEVASVTIGIDGPGGSVSWAFNRNGQAVGNWQPASDRRIKDNIKRIADPLTAMRSISGCEWDRLDNGLHGYGFIAQEVESIFPQAVTVAGDIKLSDDSVVEDAKTVDTFGLSAALHHEAILALMDTVDNLTEQVTQLQAEVQALKS